ncbi:hypothetical protein HMPREF1508_1982 [Shuttleworthella sp. MSX8B]|nr:hypothetical protein HMPREF1508_1982 [Shuttleworthia sp. MSX8B]
MANDRERDCGISKHSLPVIPVSSIKRRENNCKSSPGEKCTGPGGNCKSSPGEKCARIKDVHNRIFRRQERRL